MHISRNVKWVCFCFTISDHIKCGPYNNKKEVQVLNDEKNIPVHVCVFVVEDAIFWVVSFPRTSSRSAKKRDPAINQSKTLSMLGTNYDTYLICLKTSQKLDPFKDITCIYAR